MNKVVQPVSWDVWLK